LAGNKSQTKTLYLILFPIKMKIRLIHKPKLDENATQKNMSG
jgi:hypothetical protein